jgi:nucleoside phosphorylase
MNRLRSPDILVISALKQEIAGFIRHARPINLQLGACQTGNRYWEPAEYSGSVGFRVCGVGGKRARKDLIPFLKCVQPRKILIAGFSGSLVPDLSIGDVVVADSTRYEETAAAFDPGLTRAVKTALQSTRAGYIDVQSVTVDSVVDTAAEKARLQMRSSADCVDMESYHLAVVAHHHGIPAAMVRVITDLADESLGLDFSRIPRGKWPSRRYFLCRPQLWHSLYTLHLNTTRAAACLTAATRSVLTSLLCEPVFRSACK